MESEVWSVKCEVRGVAAWIMVMVTVINYVVSGEEVDTKWNSSVIMLGCLERTRDKAAEALWSSYSSIRLDIQRTVK
jgi:hypothetical protein